MLNKRIGSPSKALKSEVQYSHRIDLGVLLVCCFVLSRIMSYAWELSVRCSVIRDS